ncbi:MAG: hypothetical protein Q4A54_05045 [Parabacteroides sp.]|nr:hypothetical protein [Parabacteroides sp.]
MANNPIDKMFSGKDDEHTNRDLSFEEPSLRTLFEEQDFERMQKILENTQLSKIEEVLQEIRRNVNGSIMNIHAEIHSTIPKAIKEELQKESNNILSVTKAFITENVIKKSEEQIKSTEEELSTLKQNIHYLLLIEKLKFLGILILSVTYFVLG